MKCETIILDVDGCIFRHKERGPICQWFTQEELLPGVADQFEVWESRSAVIILMTARPECVRDILEEALLSHGIFWNQLIMGVGHGTRVLINDVKPGGVDSAVAINLPRNKGL